MRTIIIGQMPNPARWYVIGSAFALAALATACGSSPSPQSNEDAPASVAKSVAPVTEVPGGHVYGKLLHAVKPEADHSVEFYELAPGDYLMRETQSMDAKAPPLLQKAGPKATLVDVYKLAMPTATDADVPAVLKAADAITVRFVAARLEHADEIAARAKARPDQGSVSEALDDSIFVPPPAQDCSPDYDGDGWGGQWFLDSSCNDLNFRECDTNQQLFQSNQETTQTFFARQMEGDWNNIGHSQGQARDSQECEGPWWDPICTNYDWQVVWDFDVQPRQVSWMQSTGGYPTAQKAAWGWSECSHGHHAWLFN